MGQLGPVSDSTGYITIPAVVDGGVYGVNWVLLLV
jgi:hypothetical protein